MFRATHASAPFDPLRMSRRDGWIARNRDLPIHRKLRRNLHNRLRFRLEAMAPDLREGQMSIFAKRIMRKPRTLHCPYCDGKVLFTRNEDHLDAKNCPHSGMRVERREGPAKLTDPRPTRRRNPGGPDRRKTQPPTPPAERPQ